MYVGAIFFPLLGATISGLFGRWLGDKLAQWASVLCMVLAAICGVLSWKFSGVAFRNTARCCTTLFETCSPTTAK